MHIIYLLYVMFGFTESNDVGLNVRNRFFNKACCIDCVVDLYIALNSKVKEFLDLSELYTNM